MQLSSDDKNPCTEKQCSCHFNGLQCVAASRSCHGTECQNGVTSELLVYGQNDIEDRLYIQFMIPYNFLSFLIYNGSLIQKVTDKL